MKNQKGFTLVELIIVIAVIGVLAAILIPVFANVIEKSNKSSALSDAKNATETYIAEVTTGDGSTPPTLIIAVHKGSKAYTFVYAPGSDEGVKIIEGAEKKYDDIYGIEGCGMQIVDELEDAGYIEADPNSYADPNALLGALGYDVIDGIYVEKDYALVDGMDINEATTTDDMSSAPAPAPRTPVAVRPTFDAVEEVYTFTITASNITRNMAIPGESDPVTYGAALDFGPVIAAAVNDMGTMNWNGYEVKIVNNSGANLNFSKIIINVPSGVSGFTCAFASEDDVAAFAADPSTGTALSTGENVITTNNLGSDGMFLLGYTGGTLSGDTIDDFAEATATMYFKN